MRKIQKRQKHLVHFFKKTKSEKDLNSFSALTYGVEKLQENYFHAMKESLYKEKTNLEKNIEIKDGYLPSLLNWKIKMHGNVSLKMHKS